jgi:hypothetical protein
LLTGQANWLLLLALLRALACPWKEPAWLVGRPVEKDNRDWKNRDQASNLLVYFQSFDFVFYLHLLLTTLTIINTSSLALQCKDQDIVNAMIGVGNHITYV